jgi:prephenate dehydrogenase
MKEAVVIGLGLIGGSLALELKKRANYKIKGIDVDPANVQKALELGIIDEETTYEGLQNAEVVIIAVPVNKIGEVALRVLDRVESETLVMDVGSVKGNICREVASHPRRSQFVAAHPMAGTEFSGPEAAIYDLFDGKVMVLCDVQQSDWRLLDRALSISKLLNMRVKMMSSEEHDRHIAYVSHLSHVISYVLGQTVLEKERDEAQIFDMASSGFASTVRLAKSTGTMWSPIFLENRDNVLQTLNEYMENLAKFRTLIAESDDAGLRKTISDINYIKKVLKG